MTAKLLAVLLTVLAALLPAAARAQIDAIKVAPDIAKLSCEELYKRYAAMDPSKPYYDRYDIEIRMAQKNCGGKQIPKNMSDKDRAAVCASLDKDLVALTQRLPRNATERKARDSAQRERQAYACPGPVPHAPAH